MSDRVTGKAVTLDLPPLPAHPLLVDQCALDQAAIPHTLVAGRIGHVKFQSGMDFLSVDFA